MADDRFVKQVKLVDEKIMEHDLLYENEAQETVGFPLLIVCASHT